MLSVTIKISGDKETIAKLGKLGQSFMSFQMAMREIGKELPAYFAGQVYVSQGGALGEKWEPLKQATKNRKAKMYPGAQPLVATGTMQKSFDAEYPDANSVMIGNTAPYFVYHQSKAPRSKLPRRVMISSGGSVRTIIAQIIDTDIRNKIAKAGL